MSLFHFSPLSSLHPCSLCHHQLCNKYWRHSLPGSGVMPYVGGKSPCGWNCPSTLIECQTYKFYKQLQRTWAALPELDARKQGSQLWYNGKNKPGAEPVPKKWKLTVDLRLCCNTDLKRWYLSPKLNYPYFRETKLNFMYFSFLWAWVTVAQVKVR